MRVLAIDTSSTVLGVAVLDDKGQSAEFNFNLGLRHASHLVPTIKYLLKFAGLTLKDIDAYCVSIGPGSFTGLRIGVSTIKALALMDKKKVVAVPSLDVLAYNIPLVKGRIGVVIDAKKEKVYACFYEYKDDAPKKVSPYFLIGYQELSEKIKKYKADVLLGDGVEQLPVASCQSPVHEKKSLKIANKEFWYPKAINVARIGLGMLKKGKVVKNIDGLTPFYMHPKDVQCKK